MSMSNQIDHIDLFAGIGGFSLASHWMGWRTVATCEIADYPRAILEKNFPQAYHHDDIHTLTKELLYDEINKRFDRVSNRVILTGGFPCQPFSLAGARKGTEDDRHLWPQMLRIIREVKPFAVVGENVAGILSMESGETLKRILSDLEGEGYKVQCFAIPACGVEAIHKRDRVWIIAYNEEFDDGPYNSREGQGQAQQSGEGIGKNASDTSFKGLEERREGRRQEDSTENRARLDDRVERHGDYGPSPDPSSERAGMEAQDTSGQEWELTHSLQPKILQQGDWEDDAEGLEQSGTYGDAPYSNSQRCEERCDLSVPFSPEQGEPCSRTDARRLLRPTISPVCRADDGLPSWVDGSSKRALKALIQEFGREVIQEETGVDCTHFDVWRTKRLKALGNAIVPQVAFEIFQALNTMIND